MFVAIHFQVPIANTHRWLLKVASRFAQISSAQAPTLAWPNEDFQSATTRLDDPVERKQARCKVADQEASTFFQDKLEVKNILLLVITKGYRVRATTIKGEKAFALSFCFA